MNPVKVYNYLIQARSRVLVAARALTPEQYIRPMGFGLGTAGSTLAHLYTSEWYYVERWQGHEVPPYATWPVQYQHPPALPELESRWRPLMQLARGVIAAERNWQRPISYDTFADEQGRRFRITATPADIFAQLALHEAHHRAQLLAMLRLMGDAPTVEDIDYNEMMYERVPLNA